MTSPNDAITAPAAAAPETAHYETLEQIRAAHATLQREIADRSGSHGSNVADLVGSFLSSAPEVGRFLSDARERKAAQAIVDYWTAERASSNTSSEQDVGPLLLAPFDEAMRSTSQPVTDERLEQFALIRLVALARQWKNSGKLPAYLLQGQALETVRLYQGKDADLDEFLASSQVLSHKYKRRRIRVAALLLTFGLAFAFLLVSWGSVKVSQYSLQTKKAEKFAILLKASSPQDQRSALQWLSDHQNSLPAYDFGAMTFFNVTAPGLQLQAPDFTNASFNGVAFDDSDFRAASFVRSRFAPFSSDGKMDGKVKANSFENAGLRKASFREALIRKVSFSGADLSGAIFERSDLCGVSFEGANIRTTSFWAANFDEKTEESLEGTAWWLAYGWRWDRLQTLNPALGRENVSKRHRDGLSRGLGFDLKQTFIDLNDAAAGSIERAKALNDLAWFRASWSIDTPVTSRPRGTLDDPCAKDAVPRTALGAAQAAVCIAVRLNGGPGAGEIADLLGNLEDTLAYVQMQDGDIEGARKTYQSMVSRNPTVMDSGETLFRSAIADHAAAVVAKDKDAKALAIEQFKTAIESKQYQPTHELRTLGKYIFAEPAFTESLEAMTNRLWPVVDRKSECSAE